MNQEAKTALKEAIWKEPAPAVPEAAKENLKSGKLSIGMDELQALIAASVSTAVEKSSQVIAAAMLEARKPYIAPTTLENERRMRESTREIHERIKRSLEADQASCEHLQGSNSLSEFQGQLGSFILHQLDTGVVVGICSNCQKQIWSNEPADAPYFRRKSANRMSRAGQRVFMDPKKAQATR